MGKEVRYGGTVWGVGERSGRRILLNCPGVISAGPALLGKRPGHFESLMHTSHTSGQEGVILFHPFFLLWNSRALGFIYIFFSLFLAFTLRFWMRRVRPASMFSKCGSLERRKKKFQTGEAYSSNILAYTVLFITTVTQTPSIVLPGNIGNNSLDYILFALSTL